MVPLPDVPVVHLHARYDPHVLSLLYNVVVWGREGLLAGADDSGDHRSVHQCELTAVSDFAECFTFFV